LLFFSEERFLFCMAAATIIREVGFSPFFQCIIAALGT
jgi:hypothetical protein